MLILRSRRVWTLLAFGATTLLHTQSMTHNGPGCVMPSPSDYDLLFQPVEMTHEGINRFFTAVYNSPRYTQEILPESLANLSEFLTHGKQMNFGREYARATLSLFSQKVKGCEYISAYEFNTFLSSLRHLIDHYFLASTTRDQRRKDMKKVLYQEFLNNFDLFKENPSAFFDTLSDQLLEVAYPDEGSISIESLRSTVIRFLETSLSKIYWDPNDQQLWSSVRDLSNGLSSLQDMQIIVDSDDLNDLYWSLAHRLCYFVNLVGSQLPEQFYEDIYMEMRKPSCCLLLHEEQVSLIESKRAMIQRVVTEQLAKKQASSYGIITESIS